MMVSADFSDSVDTLLVVPCYNEVRRLRLDRFREAMRARPWLGLLFVDDGSTDGTARLLEEALQPEEGTVVVHRLEYNVGKGEAVRTGLRIAADTRASYCGYWDADLATPLDAVDEFRALLEVRSRTIAVLGSRVRLLGREITRTPLRHYLGRIFATMASLALDLPVYDTQCGAKLFRQGPVLRSVVEQPFLSRWIFDVELLQRIIEMTELEASDGTLVECPLRSWTDVDGSRLRPRDAIRAATDLARIWRSRAGSTGIRSR